MCVFIHIMYLFMYCIYLLLLLLLLLDLLYLLTYHDESCTARGVFPL